jgi:di/tricarboxylate transporter/CRP-like cAMP-binding protein
MVPEDNHKRDSRRGIDYTSIRLLSDLDRISLAKLVPSFEEIHLRSGEILYRTGDAGDAFYIVVEGIVRVFLQPGGRSLEIACLGPGEWFGEMALLADGPRTNDIEAQTDLVLLKLSRDHFDSLIKKHPSLGVSLAGLLASKLVSSNVLVGKGAKGEEGTAIRVQQPQAGRAVSERHLAAQAVPFPSRVGRFFRDRRVLALILAIVACAASTAFLTTTSLTLPRIMLMELLVVATIAWSLQALSFHTVSIALPVATVLLGITTPGIAFSGFSSSTWFLVLGVFGLSAAISKTGLLYRLTLLMMIRFPRNYAGQAFAVALSGLVLTPVIPSPNGRLILSSPLVLTLTEILGFKKGSAGAVGLSMANLLGYGNMSIMFMNGSFVCFFMIALLPSEVGAAITWGYWFKTALILSLSYFLCFYLAIILFYRPDVTKPLDPSVVNVQLKTLGPLSGDEKVCLLAVVISLAGFLTQSWHHIDGAWISLTSLLILLGSSVLDDKTVRANIDWPFLVALGALLGFGNVISASGLTQIVAETARPYIHFFTGSNLVFLLTVALGVVVIRFFLPAFPAIVVCMLALLPIALTLAINPFVIGLVVLLVNEPWFFPHQNLIFQTLMSSSEGRLFEHGQTVKFAFLHVAIAAVAIVLSFPYWKYLGLFR